jgi:chaperonin cofactor prefoldin
MNWQMIGTLVTLLGFVGNIVLFVIIKFNDLKHLTLAVEKLVSKIEIMDKSMTRVRERLSRLEGKIGK